MITLLFKFFIMKTILFILITGFILVSCQYKNQKQMQVPMELVQNADSNTYLAPFAAKIPVLDGFVTDSCWQNSVWDTLNQNWLGLPFTPEDFCGRYKMVWNGSSLYFYLEITDDSLLNKYEPLVQYWDDDCVEIFIDEDASGGNHQYNHQAFAYHIAPDMDAVDIGPDQKANLYNSHVKGICRNEGTHYFWELAVLIYPNTFDDLKTDNQPIELNAGKVLGFSMAYCDNDTSETRENFIGSVNTPGHFKNDGWMDASCFGKLILKP